MGVEPPEDDCEPSEASSEHASDPDGGDAPSHEDVPVDRERLCLVASGARERDAAGAASKVTEALAQYLLCAEQRVMNQTEYMCVSVLDELERHRASTESLISLFADRLRQQEEGLNGFRTELGVAIARLDRQADLIRSLNEAQGRDTALWRQFLEVIRHLAAVHESAPVASHPTSLVKK